MNEEFLSSRELAVLLGVHAQTPAQWRYEGKGPRFEHVGRAVRYRRSDVTVWIREQNPYKKALEEK